MAKKQNKNTPRNYKTAAPQGFGRGKNTAVKQHKKDAVALLVVDEFRQQ